jgi:hypothetical protein
MMRFNGPKRLITTMAAVAMVALGAAPVSAQIMGGGGERVAVAWAAARSIGVRKKAKRPMRSRRRRWYTMVEATARLRATHHAGADKTDEGDSVGFVGNDCGASVCLRGMSGKMGLPRKGVSKP